MRNARFWLWVVGGLIAAVPFARAAERAASDAAAATALIDKALADRWAADKVQPAGAAGDAAFLRRVYLDIAGRIPSVSETRSFLKDTSPDKRARLIDKLLASQRYASHFSIVWRNWMMPEANATIQARIAIPNFQAWLRSNLVQNTPYDQLVRDILTVPVTGGGMQNLYTMNQNDGNPGAYYLAKEMKAENIAASTSRLFLGVRLECAQCHNHPFADWKRDQFWGYAAFFAGLEGGRAQGDAIVSAPENTNKKEIKIPGTEKVVRAAFLDGAKPKFADDESPRKTLAEWMTSPQNPYFARAVVNRMWGYFFGTGLIDPVDEMVGADNVASHPELLDQLAKELVAHDFDLRFLIRAIANSKAYQLSSVTTGKGTSDPRLFARMTARGLTAEQLFESVAQAIGYPVEEQANGNPRLFLLNANNSPMGEFVTKFSNQNEKSTDTQTSILQALALMNGRFVGDATNLERAELLAAVADAPFMDDAARIETLYLAALTRPPTAKEMTRMLAFLEKKSDPQKRKQALGDIFWVLLNSGEFMFNH